MVKIERNCNEHSMNISHFFAIDFCEWARQDGGAATGQNRPKYGGFPLPAARAGQDGAGGLPPRAGPDRWKKYAGTAGFWPPQGGRAGAGRHGAAAASLHRLGNRRGTGRRRAGRGRKISRRARGGGRTWSGGSIIVQAGGIPAAGAEAQNRSAREARRTDGGENAGTGRRAGGCRTAARALIIGTIQRTGLAAGRAGRA